MTPSFVIVFVAMVSLVAFETIIYWHRITRGTWKQWPAGRSLMYLLLIIAFGFGYGVLNQFLGDYPAKPYVGFGVYTLFIAALLVIRLTIRAEMKAGHRRVTATLPVNTGHVDVVVATENKEKDSP